MCPNVPLRSNNRSKGTLGITFHRFSVNKYAKESWIVRIRGDVGKNFQVSDCGLRLQAKQALSVINFFKVIWSTRIMCRAELLFYYVPYVLLLPVIKRYNCSLDFENAQRFARNILNHQTFERPSLGNFCICWLFGEGIVPGIVQRSTEGTEPFLQLYAYSRECRSKFCRWFKIFRANLCIFASWNLKNNCNVLLRQ